MISSSEGDGTPSETSSYVFIRTRMSPDDSHVLLRLQKTSRSDVNTDSTFHSNPIHYPSFYLLTVPDEVSLNVVSIRT